MLVFAAKVWHYWLGVAIILATILTLVALAVGYLVKVEAARFPRRR